MVRVLLYLLFGLCLLVSAGCNAQGQPHPDCSRALSAVSQELVAMAKQGQFKKAQKKAESVESCYGDEVTYWTMRIELLPSSYPQHESSHADAVKAVHFIDQAINVATISKSSLQVMKSNLLFIAGRPEEAESIYIAQMRELLRERHSSNRSVIAGAALIQTAPYYIKAMKKQDRLADARAQLAPYLAWICKDWPKYRQYYATTLIWLSKNLDTTNSRQPSDKKTQSEALDDSCMQFRQTAAELKRSPAR